METTQISESDFKYKELNPEVSRLLKGGLTGIRISIGTDLFIGGRLQYDQADALRREYLEKLRSPSFMQSLEGLIAKFIGVQEGSSFDDWRAYAWFTDECDERFRIESLAHTETVPVNRPDSMVIAMHYNALAQSLTYEMRDINNRKFFRTFRGVRPEDWSAVYTLVFSFTGKPDLVHTINWLEAKTKLFYEEHPDEQQSACADESNH